MSVQKETTSIIHDSHKWQDYELKINIFQIQFQMKQQTTNSSIIL